MCQGRNWSSDLLGYTYIRQRRGCIPHIQPSLLTSLRGYDPLLILYYPRRAYWSVFCSIWWSLGWRWWFSSSVSPRYPLSDNYTIPSVGPRLPLKLISLHQPWTYTASSSSWWHQMSFTVWFCCLVRSLPIFNGPDAPSRGSHGLAEVSSFLGLFAGRNWRSRGVYSSPGWRPWSEQGLPCVISGRSSVGDSIGIIIIGLGWVGLWKYSGSRILLKSLRRTGSDREAR